MMKRLAFFLLFVLSMAITPRIASAATPIGSLDLADNTTIAGWAKDSDYTGAVWVHIYVDDKLYDIVLADKYRSDVGWHAFHYVHPPFGSGTHQVKVFVIGVNGSGQADGQNPLFGGPKAVTGSCSGLTNNALGWCQAVPQYWSNKQADTKRLIGAALTTSLNNSYGGAIFELYGADRSVNLVDENGGAAVQLSIWGYGNNNEHNLSSTDYCAGALGGTAYPWPFNPIQTQQTNCSWATSEGASNDVDYQASTATGGWQTRLDDAVNYTNKYKFSGIKFGQITELGDAYIKVQYAIDYTGNISTGHHPQEIPAMHLNLGSSGSVYYNSGSAWTNGAVTATSLGANNNISLNMLGRAIPGKGQNGNITEGWYSVCNADSSRCVTVATSVANTLTNYVDVSYNSNNQATYASPMGYFNLTPGAHYDTTLYIFPYKFDAVVSGKTIRQRIYELNGH